MRHRSKSPALPQSKGSSRLTVDFVFFIAYFLYLWLRINPALYFQRQQPILLFDFQFLKEFLSLPGGPVAWSAAFLSQFYYYSWVGAGIITALAILSCWLTRRILPLKNAALPLQLLSFVPAVLLLILHGQYNHPLAHSVGFVVGLLFFYIYLKLAPQSLLKRLGWWLCLLLLVYYFTAGVFWLFVLLSVLVEVFSFNPTTVKSVLTTTLMLILAILLPYCGRLIFFMVSPEQAYFKLLPLHHDYRPQFAPYLLYLFLPVTLMCFQFKPENFINKKIEFLHQPVGKWVTTGLIILLVLITVYLSFDKNTHINLLVDYYARHQQWEQVLTIAKKRLSDNILIPYHTNRALFWQGKLLHELFAYSQVWGEKGLFLPQEFGYIYPIQISDLFWELGHLNEAQHWAYEAQAVYENSPWNIQRLALVNLVKERLRLAQRYIHILNKMLPFQGVAKKYREYLQDHTLLLNNPDLRRIRAVNPNTDFIVNNANPPDDLKELLIRNKNNKMAFEYLMAYYLLTRQLDKIHLNIPRFRDLNYPAIPRHCEEALLVYMSLTQQRELDLAGYQIQAETVLQFQDFYRILNRYRTDQAQALQQLKAAYGNSYWYFLLTFQAAAQKTLTSPPLTKPGVKR